MRVNRPLYTGFSSYAFIQSLFYRLVILGVAIVALSHYDENPVVISIFAFLCLLFLLFFGSDEIRVYPDRVVQSGHSLASLFFGLGTKTFLIKDVAAASLEPAGDPVDTGLGFFLLSALNAKSSRGNTRPVFLDLKTVKRSAWKQNWTSATERRSQTLSTPWLSVKTKQAAEKQPCNDQ